MQIPEVVARKTLSKHLWSSGWREQPDGAVCQGLPDSSGKFRNVMMLQFAHLLNGSNRVVGHLARRGTLPGAWNMLADAWCVLNRGCL